MFVLVYGLGMIAAALLWHLLQWRLCLPKHHTRALLLIFLGLLAAVEVLLLLGQGLVARWLPLLPASWPQRVQLAILVTGFALAYITHYSAIEEESYSLSAVRAISKAGRAGLREEDLHLIFEDPRLVASRLKLMQQDGMIVQTDGLYHLTPKGRWFAGTITFYRRLLGAGLGG